MRISDWSSDVCSSDLARLPGARHDPDDAAAGRSRSRRLFAAPFHRLWRIADRRRCAAPRASGLRVRLRAILWHDRKLGRGFLSVACGARRAGQADLVRQALAADRNRSEEHTSELQSLMRISYAVFCLKKKKQTKNNTHDLLIEPRRICIKSN